MVRSSFMRSLAKALIYLAFTIATFATNAETFTNTYDQNNRLIRSINENGGAYEYTYDAAGNLLTIIERPPATYTLTVAKNGGGSGTVGGGGTFPYNTIVTPTASPATGSVVSSWTPSGCGSPFPITSNITCTATFSIAQYTLTVNKTGSGSSYGSVSGGGVYNYNTFVTPTATAEPIAAFVGWSPSSCGSPFPLTSNTTCTATFYIKNHLTTTVLGGGKLVSDPAGINCSAGVCGAYFTDNTTVLLVPTPDSGYYFQGWSGDCFGTGACSISMTKSRDVTATFSQWPMYNLTVFKSGKGAVLDSSGTGINCGSTCSYSYMKDAWITLKAQPEKGNTFMGWTGPCSGKGDCLVQMSSAKSVGADFKNTYTLIMPAINLLLLE